MVALSAVWLSGFVKLNQISKAAGHNNQNIKLLWKLRGTVEIGDNYLSVHRAISFILKYIWLSVTINKKKICVV